jgi:hypothetical protein
MKYLLILMCSFYCVNVSVAQNAIDTLNGGASQIFVDARLSVLDAKMKDRFASMGKPVEKPTIIKTSSSGIVLTSGYRLMVISSPDRELVLKVRGQLFEYYPDQKQYMTFQMPNSKLKFGNFLSRPQAEAARKKIMAMRLVTNNIYIVPEQVEMKVEKTVEGEEDTKKDKKDSKPKK